MTFVCTRCGAATAADPRVWRCPACGGVLELPDSPIDPGTALAGEGVWRYLPWLPVAAPLSIGEPTTPLTTLSSRGRRVLLKLEGAQPTGSFKDRGAAVLVSWLLEQGAARVADDSSGNAGAALAAYCARAGLACEIYVPADAAPSKIAQIQLYGARAMLVPGPRSAATDALVDAAANGLVYAGHSWSPLYTVGTQTFAWELWEQLGRRAPDVVVVPVGGGSLILGIHRGFRALLAAGAIARLPRLVGVQAAACAPLARAAAAGAIEPVPVEPTPSIAAGIQIARPERGHSVLRAVDETSGTVVAVDEDEIVNAHRALAAQGVFVEPTSATALAALARIEPDPAETVVLPMTGNGLKSPPRRDD